MTIVMGLDQHRAQTTADWLDTETGEVSRARVLPADRAGVRRFLARFAGQRLEVALEATTGWAVRRGGAARDRRRAASGRAGGSQRPEGQQEASQDRPRRCAASARAADGRAAAGVLHRTGAPARSPRAGPAPACPGRSARRVAATRPRGALSPRAPAEGRTAHAANRTWLERLALPDAAREQVKVALAMIDALDAQSAGITVELRATRAARPVVAR
jgi:hypothetical protein